ncbi:metal transporter [Burkholderia ubonensis]|uniref:efflux RND transporter periplasmic adaptor subunit n=1 Tax=Burkholderia ubonensis TaxID=101571 RepID=UPI0007598D44|nr:efflux RND transporter periplasmic adaptor subunit [Burkholderia ubonensis]KWC23388.1 metal transporter [Burkholderia ubonensis]KWC29295.1 metal transporter [Burkholderia ubonensis]
MKPRLLILSTVTIALASAACWYIYQTLSAPSSPAGAVKQAAPQPTVQTVNGETVVVVGPDVQRASHIEVSPLVETAGGQTRAAYATVLDLQPFFDLRNRLAAARADLETLTAQAGNSRAQYARSRTLFEDDRNVSRKSLQDADAVMQADDAKLRSAKAAVGGLDATLRQQFGDVLASAAAAPASDLLQRLQAGRAAVLRVSLPGGQGDDAPARITVTGPDGRPVPAQRLSASPTADPAVQGVPWLYVVPRVMPAGARTSAGVPVAGTAAPSLVIPERAVLWYGGQTWVYVKTAPDRFTRRFVPASGDDDRGFVVTKDFHAGDEVVTQGAQLLLSEELKPQGNATVCKDPPECDD